MATEVRERAAFEQSILSVSSSSKLCVFCSNGSFYDAFYAAGFFGGNLNFSPNFLFHFEWGKGREVKSLSLPPHVFINRS
ncbi:hypothetical protein [Desulfosporosinus sp. BG]|uniref:hypothetical protein n=1 Tax=Desulfosporosinus sp. BG TaxID=1633135 RepID=UPI001FA6BAF9|nr:hypothetical protein [Desulfosporosinus sp. BG]